jgi:hypothetical protein
MRKCETQIYLIIAFSPDTQKSFIIVNIKDFPFSGKNILLTLKKYLSDKLEHFVLQAWMKSGTEYVK